MTLSILVVDDHDLNRRMLKMLLEMDGHGILEAASAAEVRERMAQARPDVVLMDVSLPDGDGLDLVRELRDDPRNDGVRMYAVTAHVMEETRRRAAQSGCDGFFEKPLDTDAVLAAMRDEPAA